MPKMLEQPKCCQTCKSLQMDESYCHRRKEKRYDLLGDCKCDFWAKSWRNGWCSDVGVVITKPVADKYVDALSWAEK